MEKLDERGISDILAIAFMILFAIFAGVVLHAYRFDAIVSATNRQLQIKAEYTYRTLELAQVENYSLTYFQGVAENLIGIGEAVVPYEILQSEIENVLEYLRPADYGVMVELNYENESWAQIAPSGTGQPASTVTKYTFSGYTTIIIAEAGENRVAQVSSDVSIFKI